MASVSKREYRCEPMANAPRVDSADAIYEVASLFRERCLVDGASLLWPNDRAWSPENLDQLAEMISSIKWPRQQIEALSEAVGGESRVVGRIATDLIAVYLLYPKIKRDTKVRYMNRIMQAGNLDGPDQETWNLVEAAFNAAVPGAGHYSRINLLDEIGFILQIGRRSRASRASLSDPQELRKFVDSTATTMPGSNGHIRFTIVQTRNALLHLLMPTDFVSVTGQEHRNAAIARYASMAEGVPPDDQDTALRVIREMLRQKLGKPNLEFYDEPLVHEWRPRSSGEQQRSRQQAPSIDLTSSQADTAHEQVLVRETQTFGPLASVTHLDEPFLRDIEDLLRDKRQLIFQGPPGSGKTFVAEKFARWFTGHSLDASVPLNEQVEIVQFHQSYGYEDFVQGIRPETNDDGQLVYRVRDGIFLTLCERARANPDTPFILIIDEINRGNISRIFGELLLLLEYRGMSARLPYGSGDSARLAIPDNLYIIGTMNTADRSLAQIDYALRRRFYFVRFMAVENGRAPVLERWLASQPLNTDVRDRVLRLFVTLNKRIEDELSSDYQIGHSYFMNHHVRSEDGLERIWTRAIQPLLEEYLYHHRNRDEVLGTLLPGVLLAGISDPQAHAYGREDADVPMDPDDESEPVAPV